MWENRTPLSVYSNLLIAFRLVVVVVVLLLHVLSFAVVMCDCMCGYDFCVVFDLFILLLFFGVGVDFVCVGIWRKCCLFRWLLLICSCCFVCFVCFVSFIICCFLVGFVWVFLLLLWFIRFSP